MNEQQIDYILRNYRKKSVRQIAKDLNVERYEVKKALENALVVKKTDGLNRQERDVRPNNWIYILAVLFVAMFTFLLYSKGLHFPFVNWDDRVYVTENSIIHSLSGRAIWNMFSKSYYIPYTPLTLLSYAIDFHFFHSNPFGFHLTSLMIHTINTILVFALVFSLTQDWLVALGATVIFAIHPVQVESVIWVSERKNVLSSLLFLVAFISYTKLSSKKGYENFGMGIAMAFFVLACLAKPSAVILPVTLVVFDLCFRRFEKSRIVKYCLFFAISIFFVAVNSRMAQHHVATQHLRMNELDYQTTMMTMSVIMMRYFGLMLFPLKQSLLYSFPPYDSFFHPDVMFSIFSLLLIASFLYYLWRSRKDLFFWLSWYFILLLPVTHIIPFPGFLMQDRYLYLPLVGFFTFFLILLRQFFGRVSVMGVIFLSLIGFSFLNFKRQDVWAKPEILWQETEKSMGGEYYGAHNNLGSRYLEQGLIDRAIQEFEKAVGVYDKDPGVFDNLGIAYWRKRQFEKAITYFNKAISMDPNEPKFHNDLANIYHEQKRYQLALDEMRRTVALDPRSPQYRNNLGIVLNELGMNQEAEKEYLHGLEFDPANASALFNLGELYFNRKEIKKAEKYWELFLRFYPNDSRARKVKALLNQNASQNIA